MGLRKERAMNSSMPIGLDGYVSDNELESVVLFAGYPDVGLKLACVCCVMFMVIGVPGNFLTIVSLTLCKKIQNATAIFIINLSVVDLLFCALILPFAAFSYWTQSWMHGRVMCRLFPLLNYVFVIVSLGSVMAIAIIRYILICHPMYYCRIYTKLNIGIMLATMWIFAIGIILLPYFEVWGRMSLDPGAGSCTIIQDIKHRNPKKIIVSTVLAIAFSTILLCYTRIMIAVKKSSVKCKTRTPRPVELESVRNKRTSCTDNQNDSSVVYSNSTDISDVESSTNGGQNLAQQSSHHTHENTARKLLPNKKDKKLRTMVFATLICLFVCYVPISLVKLLYKEITTYPTFNIIGYMLIYAAPCVNPVLYVFMSKEYRQAYKSVLK